MRIENRSSGMCLNDIILNVTFQKQKGNTVLLVFLDITDAYNTVCLKTLDLLLRLEQIHHIYTDRIINFLSKRVLVLGNCREEVCGGKPQGSCL